LIEWGHKKVALEHIEKDGPITYTTFSKENDILEIEGWKRFDRLAKTQTKFTHMVNQAKRWSFTTVRKYKFI
jgi:hypothetical protein